MPIFRNYSVRIDLCRFMTLCQNNELKAAKLKSLQILTSVLTCLFKFCVHKDKRKLLESLTKEIHQDKNKTFIINELVKNISKGSIYFDSSSLFIYGLIVSSADTNGIFKLCI